MNQKSIYIIELVKNKSSGRSCRLLFILNLCHHLILVCHQLFRKDLISAMKLPDSEPLTADEFWTISDQWKQEWERGVQVPVNPDSLPGPSVTVISPHHRGYHDFRL